MRLSMPSLTQFTQFAGALAVAAIGAFAARALGTPIPFLLGSLVLTAAVSLALFAGLNQRIWFPQPFRKAFVAVIGTMIGSTFSPELLSDLPQIWMTLAAMVIFVALAQGLGYAVYRYLGHYDQATARFAAMPGGLIEAVALGEKSGGNVELLSLQHFLRIVIVVVTVPAIISLWTGEVVGSAAGQSFAQDPAHWSDWLLIAVLSLAGLRLGDWLHLPAAHLMGPLVLTAALLAAGAIDLVGPTPLLNGAQLVVGAGLGVMFARSTLRTIAKGFGLGVVAVVGVLILGVGLSALLVQLVDLPFEALVISFAPGGVTEMGLIALSLGVSPVIVTAHHLFRILLTVSVAALIARRQQPR